MTELRGSMQFLTCDHDPTGKRHNECHAWNITLYHNTQFHFKLIDLESTFYLSSMFNVMIAIKHKT